MFSEADRVMQQYEAFWRAYRADELASLRADVERESETPIRYPDGHDGWNEFGFDIRIKDETEWLARPTIYRRMDIRISGNPLPYLQPYEYELPTILKRLTNMSSDCPLCDRLCSGFPNTRSESVDFIRSCMPFGNPDNASTYTHRYRQNGCNCDGNIAKSAWDFQTGQIKVAEFQEKLWWALDNHIRNLLPRRSLPGHPEPAHVGPPRAEIIHTVRQYERWLALELLGPNPFRPIAFDARWRTSAVVGLARSMHASEDYDAMPVLADALEEAGCERPEILAHCRQSLPHVRGCWVTTLILEPNRGTTAEPRDDN